MADRTLLKVIAYDVADDRRRRRVARLLEEEAVRMQESLFEARLTGSAAWSLLARLTALVGPDDSLRLYTVPDSALPRSHAVAGPPIASGARYWLF